MNTQTEHDIVKAETISTPIVLVLLVIVFGGLVAASLPLFVGALAILGSFVLLRGLSAITDVSIFSINIVTMIGLGLAIDYALFIVTRFREELARGNDVETALTTTMATAGRTVAFSGVTVGVAISSLVLFPVMFLKSMAYGGAAAVAIAMIAALTALPALLAVLGHRVNNLRIFKAREARSSDHGAWYRLAHSVMRRPVRYVVVLVPVLLVLGIPFLSAQLGGVDHRSLPSGADLANGDRDAAARLPGSRRVGHLRRGAVRFRAERSGCGVGAVPRWVEAGAGRGERAARWILGRRRVGRRAHSLHRRRSCRRGTSCTGYGRCRRRRGPTYRSVVRRRR